ncbi:PAS domain-containing protein [Mucilaginibacter sp. CSA2-8R]|uniref:PAS domain-containing protein n=1 Tax=Mucilaginibacter sp. CSA2-8R TaxID=3141542 RepID=UPI00315CF076
MGIDKIWYRYKKFVEAAVSKNAFETKDIYYLQERLFINIILYSLPLSLIAVIPTVIITYEHGQHYLPHVYISAIVVISTISLNRRISLKFRKGFLVLFLYAVSIFLIADTGSFSIASIYLLALSVLVALIFSKRIVYASLLANITIYATLGLIIYTHIFDLSVIYHYTLSMWFAYSLNFVFLNLLVIIQVRYIVNGLKVTILQEANLYQELQSEMREKVSINLALRESEEHYKSLFLLNPSPMWIYDADTLMILQVNDAAIRRYGYSRMDFLCMNIEDVRPSSKIPELQKILRREKLPDTEKTINTQHQTKSGETFYVDVQCIRIPFKGKNARLVISTDVTAQFEHALAIENQNAKLREIAFMQSHIVRAPLARIMGLMSLILPGPNVVTQDKKLFEFLDVSVKELDDVIRAIVSTSEETEPQTHNLNLIESAKSDIENLTAQYH